MDPKLERGPLPWAGSNDDGCDRRPRPQVGREAAALPLLQSAAQQLWEHRDEKQRVLTRAAYQELGGVAGAWAIYGGLRSVAWTDCFTVVVMVAGGIMVTVLGLYMLSGDSGSLLEGWRVMIRCNQADSGVWADVVQRNAEQIARVPSYNRLEIGRAHV